MSITRFNLPLALALAAALSASPALAQGNGKSHGNRDRVEHHDRRDDDDDDHRDHARRRDDDRRTEPRFERRASSTQRVPPGWCRGRGNPHNTAANCRYNSSRRIWERYDDRDRRWESRETYERGTNTRYNTGNRGSYDAAHRDFHASHDRQCRARAAQRPLDMPWQLQVRRECAETHQAFHRRWGIAHR